MARFMVIAQVDGEASQGKDKTPDTDDPETFIPEVKTQSKDSREFSWSAQKVVERGTSRKVAEADMGGEKKRQKSHVTRESDQFGGHANDAGTREADQTSA